MMLKPSSFRNLPLIGFCLAIIYSTLAASQLIAIDNFAAERHKAAHRQRQIIVNNDGNDSEIWIEGDPNSERFKDDATSPGAPKVSITPEEFLARRTTPLADTHVDAIFYCDGYFNAYTHISDVTEMKRMSHPTRINLAPGLIQTYDKDPLTLIIDFCRKHDMEVFWSMRMNDSHDSNRRWAPALSQWKLTHRHLLMAPEWRRFPYGNNRWSSVNYEAPEVREQVFRIVQDVVNNFDVDGIELDFCRHPVYFKPQMTGDPVTQAQCDLITTMMVRIRRMVDEVGFQRGKPLLIAVRVPDSVAYAKAIGLDFEEWLKRDTADLIIVGDYLRLEPWENSVALGKKYDVPVYACLSASRLGSSKSESSLWRGEALRAWNAGVDGIYTFNCFDPEAAIFRELGDPKKLRSLPYRYEHVVVADHGDDPGKRHLTRWLKDGEKYIRPDP